MSTSDTPESGGPLTLADRLDELLLRFELWRPRRSVIVLLGGALATVIAAGWIIARPQGAVGIEDSIPMANPAATPIGADVPPGPSPAGPPLESAPAPGRPSGVEDSDPGPDQVAGRELVVHVAGAVRRPGLVVLESGSRISDAITAAGGPSPDADAHRLNLAAPVVDGMQVRVPTIDDDSAGALLSFPHSTGASPDGPSADTPVDVNTATTDRLQTLPGVGPAIAAAIVAWRDDHGPFRSVDGLEAVPGIGPAKLEALRDHVIV